MIFTLDDSTYNNYCLRTLPTRRTDMSWTVDPMHTQVEFSAKHMGLMTVRGHFTGVRVSIDLKEDDFTASSVEATIEAQTLVTNDQRRDAHLRSEEHTSELQSRENLVCRLLLEKKKKKLR